MNRKFTETDLIRYYYNETNPVENKRIVNALKEEPNLRKQYDSLRQTLDMLDGARMEPSDTTIDIIREHSGHFSSLETS